MFEYYTEKARRTIFFARYEASHFGSPQIETEHLLLGLLRGAPELARRFLHGNATAETVRARVQAQNPVRQQISTGVDLPLSPACRQVLSWAGEEAALLEHKFIGTEHLLLALLRDEKDQPRSTRRARWC